MLRYILAFIIFLHGLIHVLGFATAFNYMQVQKFSRPISRLSGSFWLLAGLALVVVSILLLLRRDHWWLAGAISAVLSQVLIIAYWKDARFGTIVNLMIIAAAILGYGYYNFQKAYKADVKTSLTKTELKPDILRKQDIAQLPAIVQRYLEYTGFLNKPKVSNFRVQFEGQMRDKGKDWFHFTSDQLDVLHPPTRLFFMQGKMYGLTVPGYHAYKSGAAGMRIKLFGLFPIVDLEGPILDKAETVTLFNDICLLAPGALVDSNIRWEEIDALTVKAFYTVGDITISAMLYFNTRAELVNFVSDDRYATLDMKQHRFSTPVRDYRDFNGYRLASYGEAIWHLEDGDFLYGKFYTKNVEYNIEGDN